jgi:hypothetical protein
MKLVKNISRFPLSITQKRLKTNWSKKQSIDSCIPILREEGPPSNFHDLISHHTKLTDKQQHQLKKKYNENNQSFYDSMSAIDDTSIMPVQE